ncbi:radical SAM protein [bacterium]|nr:radical SAM protein [bacterium]
MDIQIEILHLISKLKNYIIKKHTKISQLKQKLRKFCPKKCVEFIEFHIVEHCNLNCKSCVHFSPLAKEEYLDIKTFKNDIKRLSEITIGKVKTINIFGGEPLLHKDLIQFLDIARYFFPNTKIRLVTNGILLSEQNEDFWGNCKKNKIVISITKYPIKLNWSLIEQKADNNGVKLEFFADDKKDSQWHFPLDLSGKQNRYTNFMDCQEANKCTNVYKGKLYICPIASNMRHFNKYFKMNIPITEKDYLDIYKIKNANEILKFCAKPSPICKYCNIKGRTFNNEWNISKKEITEWI